MNLESASWKRTWIWCWSTLIAAAVAGGILGLPDFLAGFYQGMVSGLGAARPLGLSPWISMVESILWVPLWIIGTLVLKRLWEARAESARQRRNADQARDALLRARLAPHFIFNALNTLHAQIEHDPRGAQATTERLAQLFRQVVDASGRNTIPLGEELAFVESYLGIEKARFGERLRVEIDVPEELELLEVPPLSLQVLVENAVKHGVAPLASGGVVRVEARQDEDGLRLCVRDPGDGEGAGTGTGSALALLRARLARPEDLELGPEDGGFCATFRWRQA